MLDIVNIFQKNRVEGLDKIINCFLGLAQVMFVQISCYADKGVPFMSLKKLLDKR